MKTNPFLRFALPAACATAMVFYMCGTARGAAAPNPQRDAAYLKAVADLRAVTNAAKKAEAAPDAKAASTAKAKAQAEADVALAAKAAAAAKAGGDAKAAAGAQAAMDAKISAMLRVVADAKAAQQAAAAVKEAQDAKIAAATQAKDAALKNAADAIAAARLAEEAKRSVLWQKRFEASAALAKSGHLIVVTYVNDGQGKPLTTFRYDRFPGLERVVAPDGAIYVRAAGKSWAETTDLGQAGYAPAAPGAAVAEKRAAELDAMAELAQRPLQPLPPDPVEGAVVWRFDEQRGTLTQSRERPHMPNDYPMVDFEAQDKGKEWLLGSEYSSCVWNGLPSFASFIFYYLPETAPPAQDQPEAELAGAIRAAVARPVKVDAVIQMFERTGQVRKIHLAGIISGKDYDFTFVQGARVWREIAVGDDDWSSTDGGATWEKVKDADRGYFEMVDYPLDAVANGAMFWPYEASDAGVKNGEALRRYVLKLPVLRREEGDSEPIFRVAMKDGKPAALRYFDGAVYVVGASGLVNAEYNAASGIDRVLPPPGIPAPGRPPVQPEELVRKALDGMKTGVWRVSESKAKMNPNTGALSRISAPVATGLESGKDFDLTFKADGADGNAVRVIALNGKEWFSLDGGKKWEADDAQPVPMTTEFFYLHGVLGLFDDPVVPEYKVAGKETHGSETWLYIRPVLFNMNLLYGEFWLLLDKAGNPVSVRRIAFFNMRRATDQPPSDGGARVEDFTEAGADEKIAPPGK